MSKLPPSVSMNKAVEQLLANGSDAGDLIGELLRRRTRRKPLQSKPPGGPHGDCEQWSVAG